MSMPAFLILASKIANLETDQHRKAFIGAIAIRADGTLVSARNGGTTPFESVRTPSLHAEVRVLRKAGIGSTVYVARVKRDGSLAMSRPCGRCMASLRSRRVEVVYFTTDNGKWSFCRP